MRSTLRLGKALIIFVRFIEFFSPYCSHCKHFKPTWEKLVAEVEKSADPGIHLAQVDCVADGGVSANFCCTI
jgi:thiol-disulfide isomerase/thioredoxin